MSAVLAAPSPGWTADADVVVVGSGVAGLTAALHARRTGRSVLLVTKGRVEEGSTVWAQGGIAAALDEDDSPEEHLHDTLVAGAGLCDVAAVRALVTEGPGAVRGLIGLGAHFDLDASGALALTREGGHLRDRIAHAGGDATGAEVSRALVAAVALDPGIELIEGALVLDLLRDEHGAAQGVTLHVMGQGTRDGVGAALAPAVILATGGFGQVFSQTTNPPVATGDGVALGLRAGAEVADLEFVQFHPTVLWLGPRARGQQPLVSEAVRGEGALLVDGDGQRFMVDVHPLAELAPRDVVSRAILRRMRETGSAHVWLDARAFGEKLWEERFPTILASCRAHGIDPVTELVPVAPASHYASGGVRTDLDGRASIPGLFACGEVACTGVHGANRLASNSLLEGLVFAARIGQALAGEHAPRHPPVPTSAFLPLMAHEGVRPLQQAMTDDASVIRSAESLTRAADVLDSLTDIPGASRCTDDWEATNLHLVARALVHQARIREETRGSHWREDFPERDDQRWRIRLVSHMTPSGDLVTRHENVTAPAAEMDDVDAH
ncbi:MAG: L-aspartate oxidase [Actinomycetota bacterium]